MVNLLYFYFDELSIYNEPNCEISRGIFQNHGVGGQAFPLLPSPSPSLLFFLVDLALTFAQ